MLDDSLKSQLGGYLQRLQQDVHLIGPARRTPIRWTKIQEALRHLGATKWPRVRASQKSQPLTATRATRAACCPP